MYNSQYYTCEQIDERLLQGYLDDYNTQTGQSLTKAQFLTKLGSIFSKEGVIDNTATQIGYYECDTAAGTAAKTITVANYALFAGGSMKVKFANKNTANNATLNINSQGAKALYYQGERASATNSWDAEEVVEIYYDGTSYYANNVKGGSGSGVYDVSKEHPTSGPNSDGKFTLEYILNSSNVNELIPVNKRYPGMTIQFVSTSDNKYVQYRLTTDEWSTNTENWAIAEEGVCVENPEFVYVKTDAEDKIIWAIKKDGNFYFGAGCPPQVREYIQQKIEELSLDEYEDIVSFLQDYLGSDTTLKAIIDGINESKLDKEGLDPDALSSQFTITNPEYLQVTTDSDSKILQGIKSDGTSYVGGDLQVEGQIINSSIQEQIDSAVESMQQTITDNFSNIDNIVNNPDNTTPHGYLSEQSNPEWLQVTTDSEERVLGGRKTDGTLVENVGIEAKSIMAEEATIDEANINTLNLSAEGIEGLKEDLNLGSSNELPDYYFEDDYITDKVKAINGLWLNTGANADIFAFFTDAHYVHNAMMTAPLMEYLLNNTAIRKVIYGGDTAANQSEDTIADVTVEIQTAKAIIPYAKYLAIKGNHDHYDDNGTHLPVTSVRNNILNLCSVENIVLNENDPAPYYYYDEKFSKVRYIIIDLYYTGATLQVKNAQLGFIANTLNTTPTGYCIVIMAHTTIVNGTINTTTEYNRAQNVRDLITSYQNGESVTIDRTVYNFANPKWITMYVGGHEHADVQNYINGTLHVAVPCTALWNDVRYSPMYTYHEYPARTKGTINEDCFDIVVFDRSNNVANFIRIGCGFNRKFNLNKIEINVGSTETLQSSFTTVAQWLIHDSQNAAYDSSIDYGNERWSFTNNVATIASNGTVTALSAGECYAIAIANNGDKEFFYIKVQ